MANHRAHRRAAFPFTKPEPTSRAAADGPRRHKAIRQAHTTHLYPTVPSLLGAAVLVVSGVSAVSLGGAAIPAQTVASHTDRTTTPADVVSGTGGNHRDGSSLASSGTTASSDASADREQALSRDSQREALEDAADEKLQDVAEAQARERNAALRQLALSAEKQAQKLVTDNAWVLPIEAGTYQITAGFGQSSGLWAHTHTGLDFAAPTGTPIRSVAAGQVTSTGYDGSYGNKTVVTLEDGTELWYCHQTSFAVSPGDEVSSGQTIGTVGSTGNTTGPHLHLEVRPGAGDPVDPHDALVVHGLRP